MRGRDAIAITLVATVMTMAVVLFFARPAYPAQGWQNRPLICDAAEYADRPADLERCKQWIAGVPIPDGTARCCGEGDAYIADSFEVNESGEFVAIITREYPGIGVDDGEGGTAQMPAVPLGTKVVIPKHKINSSRQWANPTGHGVVFMGPAMQVFCYFSPVLM